MAEFSGGRWSTCWNLEPCHIGLGPCRTVGTHFSLPQSLVRGTPHETQREGEILSKMASEGAASAVDGVPKGMLVAHPTLPRPLRGVRLDA